MASAWRTLMTDTDDFMFIKDASLAYVTASMPFVRLVGRESVDELVGRTDFDLFADAELARRYTDDDRRMLRENKPLTAYVEPLPADGGRQRYSETRKGLVRDADGTPIGVYGIGRDVTREYEARLNYERERRYLLELPPDAYCAAMMDVTEWRLTEVRESDRARGVIRPGEDLDCFAANVLGTIVEGDTARRFFMDFTKEHLRRVYADGIRNLMLPFRRRMEDGTVRWVRQDVHLTTNPGTMHLEAMVALRDVNEQMMEKDLLVRAAEQDSMTGLLNHEATLEHMRRYLAGAEGAHALFMIDIDNFKEVNDRYGHQRGDSMIVSTAAVLRGAFRDTDIVGRVGGDEFLALMKNVERLADVEHKAEYLVSKLQSLCCDDETARRLSGSVGLAICTQCGQSLDALYAEADAALYRAKHSGKNRYVVFGEDRLKE